MNVRDARDGVTQHFSLTRAAATMESSPLLLLLFPEAIERAGPVKGAAVFALHEGSRSDLLLQHDLYAAIDEDSMRFEGRNYGTAADALDAECVRQESYQGLVAELRATVEEAAAASPGGVWSGPFMSAAQLEELPARWVMQSIDSLPDTPMGNEHAPDPFALLRRDQVTALDVGATVVMAASSEEGKVGAPDWVIVRTAPMAAGQYWVELAPAKGKVGEDCAVRRVDKEAVRLLPPHPTYLDAFLPCDDAFHTRGTSACLYLATLLAAKGTGIGRRRERCAPDRSGSSGGASFVSAEAVAARVATTMAQAARVARRALAEKLLALFVRPASHPTSTAHRLQVTVEGKCGDMVTLTYGGGTVDGPDRERASSALSVQLLRRSVTKLARMYDIAARTRRATAAPVAQLAEAYLTSPSGGARPPHLDDFLTRLTTMVLRYQLLFGQKGYNQGPQAAIPPSVLAHLQGSFDVQAEGFASPLNAQLPVYGSLFPDTDRYFGSMGSFFDGDFLSGHVEVNPPFDAVVMGKMEQRLLGCLARASAAESLLFVVVLPSHDLDDHEKLPEAGQKRSRESTVRTSTDRALRESRFCLAQTLCKADESAYVDGHQHLLRAPFFCIGTPTRLIVLGNEAARVSYPDAQRRLDSVRASWCRLTKDELPKAAP